MNEANTCPVDSHPDAPWAMPLPEANILKSPDLWKAILDHGTKNKGRMIAVLYHALCLDGRFANNCPPEVREKVRGMML